MHCMCIKKENEVNVGNLVHEGGVEGFFFGDGQFYWYSVDICVVKEEEKERKISINCN